MRADPEFLVEVLVTANAADDSIQRHLTKPAIPGLKSGFLVSGFL